MFNLAPCYGNVLGSGDIDVRILGDGTRLQWVATFTLRPPNPRARNPSILWIWYRMDTRDVM